MKTTVAAIDLGTSKIVTLVAEHSGSQRCDIVGAGVEYYDGYVDGAWNNPDELDAAIQNAIAEAEKQSNHKIREVNVGVPGAFSRAYPVQVKVELKGTDPQVNANHVKEAFARARESINTTGMIIHCTPAWFMIDQGKKTLHPVGSKGTTLHAMISFVVADEYFVQDVSSRLTGMGIVPKNFYATTAGEAMLFLPEEDRDRTAVLIDVGYLNTDVMVVEGDALIFQHTVAIGGGDIAADLSIGLDIPLDVAEEHIKRKYAYSVATADTAYTLPAFEGQKMTSVPREQAAEIIEARVDEIVDEIKNAIDESGIKLGNWSNIYMTGGGLSFNRGGRDYLANKLGKPVRDVPKRTTKLNSHAFSSALGLMDLIIDTMEKQQQPEFGVLGKLKGFFRTLMGG